MRVEYEVIARNRETLPAIAEEPSYMNQTDTGHLFISHLMTESPSSTFTKSPASRLQKCVHASATRMPWTHAGVCEASYLGHEDRWHGISQLMNSTWINRH